MRPEVFPDTARWREVAPFVTSALQMGTIVTLVEWEALSGYYVTNTFVRPAFVAPPSPPAHLFFSFLGFQGEDLNVSGVGLVWRFWF